MASSFDTAAPRAFTALTQEVVAAAVATITHEESLRPLGESANGMNWVLGHLVHVNDAILSLLGADRALPADVTARYAPGSEPVSAATAHPFGELRDALLAQTARLDAAWESATPGRLQAPPPPGLAEPTLYHFLRFLTFHQAYHAGQCGLLRRQLGKDRAFG